MAATRRQRRRSRRHTKKQKAGATRPVPLSVRFPSGVVATPSLPEVQQVHVQDQPSVQWEKAAATPSLYTLIVVDPDAPSGPWLHWLVVNCRGTDPSSGHTLMPWAPPTPPPGSRTHRYLFTLYRQRERLVPIPPASPPRSPFSEKEFATRHGLNPLQTVGFKVPSPQSL